MKYLIESSVYIRKKPKYHIGDMVRISSDMDTIYEIDDVNLFPSGKFSYWLLDNDNNPAENWVGEDEIELVPDYEIDANKYNL